MKFTVDVSVRLIDEFRLREDGSFRAMTGTWALKRGDATFPTVAAAYGRIDQLTSPLSLGGKSVRLADPDEGRTLGDVVADPSVRVHRDEIPRTPSLADVRAAIASGDNDRPSCLIVELDGRVKLVPFEGDLVSRPMYAVRTESFTASDMAGIAAAKDSRHVRNCYQLVLDGWRSHLVTGEVGEYSDVSTKSETEMLAEIDDVIAKGYSPTR